MRVRKHDGKQPTLALWPMETLWQRIPVTTQGEVIKLLSLLLRGYARRDAAIITSEGDHRDR